MQHGRSEVTPPSTSTAQPLSSAVRGRSTGRRASLCAGARQADEAVALRARAALAIGAGRTDAGAGRRRAAGGRDVLALVHRRRDRGAGVVPVAIRLSAVAGQVRGAVGRRRTARAACASAGSTAGADVIQLDARGLPRAVVAVSLAVAAADRVVIGEAPLRLYDAVAGQGAGTAAVGRVVVAHLVCGAGDQRCRAADRRTALAALTAASARSAGCPPLASRAGVPRRATGPPRRDARSGGAGPAMPGAAAIPGAAGPATAGRPARTTGGPAQTTAGSGPAAGSGRAPRAGGAARCGARPGRSAAAG